MIAGRRGSAICVESRTSWILAAATCVLVAFSLAACEGATAPIPSIDRFTSVVPGAGLTCGVGADAFAYCWGQNNVLQVGSPSTRRCLDTGLMPVRCATYPQRVMLNGTVTKVTTGSLHACALLEDGTAHCWGLNQNGQLGRGTISGAERPGRVTGTPAMVDLHAGAEHTCGLDGTGVVWCWGVNDYGQLGRGTNDVHGHATPEPIASDLRFTSIARGFSQTTCALTAAGAAFCWGPNIGGQPPGMGVLGDTARDECLSNPTRRFGTECNMTPRRALPDLAFSDVSVGLTHGCGRTGGAWICWGVAVGGALGIGQPQDCVTTSDGIEYHQPCNRDRVPVIGSSAYTSLGAGSDWSCAIDAAGKAWCWGFNLWGWLGTGIGEHTSDVPVEVAGSLTFTSIEVGSVHACGLVADGHAWCWGYARSGNIGDGTFSDQPALEPARVVARP